MIFKENKNWKTSRKWLQRKWLEHLFLISSDRSLYTNKNNCSAQDYTICCGWENHIHLRLNYAELWSTNITISLTLSNNQNEVFM